jgi:hypothetical protein
VTLAKPLLRAGFAAVLALSALLANTGPALAFNLRSPQVSFSSASLQAYFNGLGESINVASDQLDAQAFQSSVSDNSTFTLMIELAGNAPLNTIGIYNAAAASPAFYQVFPGAAADGWFATCHFSVGGGLLVYLFDNNGVLQGSTSYSGVDRNNFGFYLQGPGGTFYSQDYRNVGGTPQALTYAGTGQNYGDWWECFEDLPYGGQYTDFEDAILLLQSLAPTPARTTSWGALKAGYR